MYQVIILPQAQRFIKLLKTNHKIAIRSVMRELKEDPFSGKPLTRELTGRYAYKVGVYRIVYKIDKLNKKIYILKVGHRAKIYD